MPYNLPPSVWSTLGSQLLGGAGMIDSYQERKRQEAQDAEDRRLRLLQLGFSPGEAPEHTVTVEPRAEIPKFEPPTNIFKGAGVGMQPDGGPKPSPLGRPASGTPAPPEIFRGKPVDLGMPEMPTSATGKGGYDEATFGGETYHRMNPDAQAQQESNRALEAFRAQQGIRDQSAADQRALAEGDNDAAWAVLQKKDPTRYAGARPSGFDANKELADVYGGQRDMAQIRERERIAAQPTPASTDRQHRADADGYALQFAREAFAHPERNDELRKAADNYIRQSFPDIGLGEVTRIVNDAFANYRAQQVIATNREKPKGGLQITFDADGNLVTNDGGSAPSGGDVPPPAAPGGDWRAVADDLKKRGMGNDEIVAELKKRGLIQ